MPLAASALVLLFGVPGLGLSWEAPRACPSQGEVEQEIERLSAGREPSLAALRVRAVVTEAVGRWRAKLWTEAAEASGERSFDAATCRELADATALIVALALFPELPRAETGPALELSLRASVAGALGSLPRPGLEAGAGIRLALGSFDLLADASTGLLSDRQEKGPRSGSGLTVSVPFSADLRGCWSPLQHPLGVGLCAGATARLTHGQGFGISSPLSSSAWWVGPSIGVVLRLGLWPRLRVYADALLSLAITRPVFVIEGFGEVHRTEGALGRVGVGLEVPLW